MPALTDSDFLMCRYMHPNRASHPVVGPAVFDRPFPGRRMRRVSGQNRSGYAFDYGYHSGRGNDTFLVHRADVDMQPQWFKPVEDVVSGLVELPKRKAPVPPVPRRIQLGMRASVQEEKPVAEGEVTGEVEALLKAKASRPFDPQLIPGISSRMAEQMLQQGIKSEADLLALGSEGLQRFEGIGKTKASLIMEYLKEQQEK